MKIAFLFAGQGAQYEGMGKSLYELPAAKAAFDKIDAVRPGTSRQCFCAGLSELNETKNTQPCVFAHELAAACALEAMGVIPQAVAGFSAGEAAALVFARYLDFETGSRYICARAKAMQRACEERPGKMAAIINLSADKTQELCSQTDGAWAANFNCPTQTVVSGASPGVDRVIALASGLGAKAMPLRVSGAFHCPHMSGASLEMEQFLQDIPIGSPRMPVYSNVTALPFPADPRELMAEQLTSAVLFQATLENMAAGGFNCFIEVGPGRALSGFVRRTLKNAVILNAAELEDVKKTVGKIEEGGEWAQEQ